MSQCLNSLSFECLFLTKSVIHCIILISSEYGESWHEGGMLLNKQNVFDDFASAAEYLIANKYTRRDRYFNNHFETQSN